MGTGGPSHTHYQVALATGRVWEFLEPQKLKAAKSYQDKVAHLSYRTARDVAAFGGCFAVGLLSSSHFHHEYILFACYSYEKRLKKIYYACEDPPTNHLRRLLRLISLHGWRPGEAKPSFTISEEMDPKNLRTKNHSFQLSKNEDIPLGVRANAPPFEASPCAQGAAAAPPRWDASRHLASKASRPPG